jgi:V8-like Glu-specific endopeptidase
MSMRKFAFGLAGTLTLSAAILAGGAAGASATPTGDGDSPGVDTWVVPQTQEAGDYWTAERMEAATPGDVLIADEITGMAAPVTESGAPFSLPSEAADAAVSPRATPQQPVDTIGKVFFTLGGSDYVCSGNSIASANESTVASAGHCVNEGPGAFATRWIFVPAYDNGVAPFGKWSASELAAPSRWTSGGDISYDTGFATVAPLNGQSLSDTVGASGVAFNQSRGLSYTAYGYPAASPFDGESLQSCAGRATNDPFGQSASQGIPCDMTGGSSGGPWFIGSGSGGKQNSINSFGYDSVSNTMFAPYWGSVIQATYASASS